jgi:hypothetical protein
MHASSSVVRRKQVAMEKLEQSPVADEAARDRHGAYYTAALQGWDADLKGPRQVAAQAEFVANSRCFDGVAGKRIAAAVAHPEGVPPDDVAAAEERGKILAPLARTPY